MPAKVLAATFCHHFYRNPRSVARHNSPRAAVRLHALKKLLLDVQPLYHHLDDPLASGYARQIVLKVAHADPLRCFFREKRVRGLLQSLLQGIARQSVARLRVRFFTIRKIPGQHVQHQYPISRIGQVAGYARAHDPGSKDSYVSYLFHKNFSAVITAKYSPIRAKAN